MSSVTTQYTIKCRDDCLVSGCPSHNIHIGANNTSDWLTYIKDDEVKFSMDLDELDAFVKQLRELVGWDVGFSRIFEDSTLRLDQSSNSIRKES